ncbi:unnamed protein product [Aphanomyces euteiches]|uniref:Calcium uniporter protein C-terminal domain-containing protein n=1 Tax=Aphanomyces euteiches TaxID=100861 RepID=A0A6G0WIM6_9STRA|nr:hypothetical protein Ae201684_014810 [Aphanomyces euteiches]KAH9072621.1 hypothetical protein Ae201684P_015696 [Aphanomyces euteiches]KAH9137148.1 hypothetical protein AeRB84_017969 [Aphanomyces euteiches]
MRWMPMRRLLSLRQVRGYSELNMPIKTSDMIEFAVRCKASEPLAFTLPLPGRPGLTRVDLEHIGASKSTAERESVGHFLSTLKELDPTLTTVSLTTMDGVTISKSASLRALAPVPLLLRLNTATLELEKEGQDGERGDDGVNDSESSAFGTVKRYIERDTRTSIPIDQFYLMCKNVGADDSTSKKWLAEFQRRNLVLHYDQSKDEALRSTVILRPNKGDSFAAFQSALDPVLYNLKHVRMAKEAQVLEAQEEWRKLAIIDTDLKAAARRPPNMKKWAGMAFIASFYTGMGYLVWDVYSWDVMEPISYFIGFSAVLSSSFYHTLTLKDATYPNIWTRDYKRSLAKLQADKKFDPQSVDAVLQTIANLKRDVQALRLLEGKKKDEKATTTAATPASATPTAKA